MKRKAIILQKLVIGIMLMLSSFGLLADTMHDTKSLERFLQKADEQLLANPNETRRIVEKILPQIHPERQVTLYIWAHFLGARSASLLGNSDEILRWVKPARDPAEKLNDPSLLVKIHTVLGEGHEFSGQMPKALEHYELALKNAELANDPWLTAFALNALGWFYNRKMEEKQAMQHIQRAYKIMKDLPHDDLYHDLLSNLGTLYGNKTVSREAESLHLLREAKTYFVTQEKHFYASVILYNLGLSLKNTQPKEALNAFRESLRSAEKIQDESSIAYCRYGIGLAWHLMDHFTEAEHEFLKADEGFIKTNNTMMSTEVQKQLMITYTSSSQFGKALRLLPKAEELTRKYAGAADVITILEQKVMVMEALARKDEELSTWRELGRLSREYQLQQDRETINKYTVEFDLERKEHERELLANQNKLQSVELEKADRTRNLLSGVAALSLCIIILGIRSRMKDRAMREQRKRMQEILESIQEGILRFGPNLLVERHYSRHLLQLLNRNDDISGQSIIDLLIIPSQLPLNEKSQIREVLQSMLGETRLAWDLNAAHLPSELTMGTRILGLNWEPLFNGQNQLHKIQLILRDMTESRQLEQKVAAEKARLDVWLSRLQQLLSQDFKRAVKFLQDITQNLNTEAPAKDLMRDLHTIKGNARTLGLKSLAEAAHQWESALIKGSLADREKQRQLWNEELQEWVPLMESMGFAGESEPQHIFDILRDILPNLQSLLAAAGLNLEELTIKDSYQVWTAPGLETLRILLLHGLTNALDHGYILPSQRGETTPPARLSIEVSPIEGQLQLIVRDFGHGLDWEKIRTIAAQRNFQPAEGRPWSDVLFLAGASTARQVSTTSGRGIGLDVIAKTCEKLQGDVMLVDNDSGKGTRLIVRWPLHKLSQSA